jgi:hypothetical protein
VDKNGTDPATVTYRLTVPPDAQLGVGAVRLRTGNGVSNVRLMLIDDLPSIARVGTNKSMAAAQVLAPPVAVDGACDPESSDFYKITAASGQRISIEVYARRLGSPLDPIVRLLNSAGREVAFSDDEPALRTSTRGPVASLMPDTTSNPASPTSFAASPSIPFAKVAAAALIPAAWDADSPLSRLTYL